MCACTECYVCNHHRKVIETVAEVHETIREQHNRLMAEAPELREMFGQEF